MVKIDIPLSKFIRHVGDLTVELSLGEIIDLLDASNNDNFLTKSIRDLEQKIFCSYEKFDKINHNDCRMYHNVIGHDGSKYKTVEVDFHNMKYRYYQDQHLDHPYQSNWVYLNFHRK